MTRPSLLTRSSRSTRRRTTSHLAGSYTAGNRERKRWEASSVATSPARLGDTGPTTGSRSFSSPTTATIGSGFPIRGLRPSFYACCRLRERDVDRHSYDRQDNVQDQKLFQAFTPPQMELHALLLESV